MAEPVKTALSLTTMEKSAMRHSQNKRRGAKQFRRNVGKTKAINMRGATRGGFRL